jgi:hypothetical protein
MMQGVTGALTETDDLMFTDAGPRLRYTPTAQQFAAVRLKHARLTTLGLAVSAFPAHRSSTAPDPWPAVRACRSLKGVGCLRVSDFRLFFRSSVMSVLPCRHLFIPLAANHRQPPDFSQPVALRSWVSLLI